MSSQPTPASLHAPAAPADPFFSGYWRTSPQLDGVLTALGETPGPDDFRLLAEYVPTLCWMARADGYIVWYNSRWYAYCGATPAEMEGWGWEKVHDPTLLPKVKATWTRSVQTGEPFEMTFLLRGADGVFRPFLTRIVPVRDGSGAVVRWFGVNTGIAAQAEAESALRVSEAKFDTLTDAMPHMVWSTLPDGHHDYYNARWFEFTGMDPGTADDDAWNGMFHPDDRERAQTRWRRCLSTGEPYEMEYRLRRYDGEYRWTLGRALPVRDASGRITRWIGTCTDIHDAKLAAERDELLSRELSHRIKNIFAVITGLVGLSARREPAMKPFAKVLSDRIAALGRAHEFARPHSENSRPVALHATLLGMLGELLSPYPAMQEGRLSIHGDDAPIDDRGATPIALVVHELATNAAKYGALSNAQGRVEVAVRREDDRLILRWREAGGPPVPGPPTHEGFGAQLAAMSVERQLGGRLTRRWEREGLDLELEVRLSRLSRDALAPAD